MRRDVSRLQARRYDNRSAERLRVHYLLEVQLAERLRAASSEERARLYGDVYSELFDSLPDHPQITVQPGNRQNCIEKQIRNIRQFLHSNATFLEIGCGDAHMSFSVSRLTNVAYGLDVTDALIDRSRAPANFRSILTRGVDIPLGDASVDVAFSDQLMEHLHPDDAAAQLREVFRVLRPGGVYWTCTPSRVTGPHDISRYFDYEARGFHLCEYDYASLRNMLGVAGFPNVRYYVGKSGRLTALPTGVALTIERGLAWLPEGLRARLTDNKLATGLLGIYALAIK